MLGAPSYCALSMTMKWWRKWFDFVKSKFHLSENIEWHYMQLEFNSPWNGLKFNGVAIPWNWIQFYLNSVELTSNSIDWRNNMMWIEMQDIENMLVTFIIHNYGVEKKWNDTNLKRLLFIPNSHKILKQNLFW
jgi:hypothetical protein